MAVSFGAPTISEFFSPEQREFIIAQYPESVRHLLVNVKNPLDINEILISATKEWSIKMIFVVQEEDYDVYFHARDVARVLDYSEKSISKWWDWLREDGMDVVRESEITRSDGAAESTAPSIVFVGDYRGGHQADTTYVTADGLRIILTRVNKPKARDYRLMLNGMATAVRRIMTHMMKISQSIRDQQREQEITDLRNMLTKQKLEHTEQIYKIGVASDIWRVPVDAPGEVYIGRFRDPNKAMMRKIGIAGDTRSRQSDYNTSDSVEITHRVQCRHAKKAEGIIRELLTPSKVYTNREFYWEVDDTKLQEAIGEVVSMVDRYHDLETEKINRMRRSFIEGNFPVPLDEAMMRVEPSLRSRSKSPSKKSLVEKELRAIIETNGSLSRGDKAAAIRKVEMNIK